MGGNPLDFTRCQWCGAPIDDTPGTRDAAPARPAGFVAYSGQANEGVAAPSLLESADPMDIVKITGNWLNKIGIVIFLLGVAFLFKYSVDQGWLNEAVRVNIGLALGTTLLVAGLLIKRDHPHLSQVLLGGSVATYYITAFAAFRIFHIDYVTFEIAFGFMAGVTLLAFLLAVTQDGVMLALIGAAGGLATPFVLYSGRVGLPDLVGYACFVMVGTVAIYMYKGWRSLLWLSFLGSWLVLALGYVSDAWTYGPYGSTFQQDRWTLQVGIGVAVLAFWIMPLLRQALEAVDPQRWPDPELPSILMPSRPYASGVFPLDAHPHIFSILTPLFALGLSALTWDVAVQSQTWGWIALGGAALYGFVMYALQPYSRLLAGTQAIAGVMLLTIGLALILEGDALLIALAAEAVALLLVGQQLRSLTAIVSGHLLFGGVAMWLLQRLMSARVDPAIVNAQALSDLAVIALAFGLSILARRREEAWVYSIGAHAAMLGWFWRELSPSQHGFQYVLLAWTAYGLAIHLWAWWRNDQVARWAGHVVFGAAGLWLLSRTALGLILGNPDDVAVFTVRGLTDLGVLAAGGLAFITLRARKEALVYGFGLHLAYLGWTWQELGLMQNGNGYVSAAWGGYAIVLIAAALRLGSNRPMLYTGIVTLFVVAGKLFLVDLRYLDSIWRSLLFIGFGGLFLLLSYSFHRITRRQAANTR
jgi:hypothetical protein